MPAYARKMSWVALLLLIVTAVPAPAQTDKMAAIEAVDFLVGDATDVFIAGTTSDEAREEAVLPCSFKVTDSAGPAEVGLIQLKVSYDVNQMQFQDWSSDNFGQGTTYWPGDIEVDAVSNPGTVIIMLDNAVVSAPTDYEDFVYLKFTPACQPESEVLPVFISFAASESFIMFDNTRYYDAGDPARDGSVTVADYTSTLSIIDPDPTDGQSVTIDLQGVVGADAVIDVPFYMAANANINRIEAVVNYDPAKLEPVAYIPETDCNDWVWGNIPPDTVSAGLVYVDMVNYPFSDNDTGIPCKYLTIQFRVIGNWPGETTTVSFDPTYRKMYIGNGYDNTCYALLGGADWSDGEVSIDPYQVVVQTEINDYIWDVPDQQFKAFTAEVSATNTFTIGGTSLEAIRLHLDLDLDMTILNLAQADTVNPDPTNPLDDFWFDYTAGTAKSPQQLLTLFTETPTSLPNRREPTTDFVPLFNLDLMLQNPAAPASFDDHTVALNYNCERDGVAARVQDAITGSIEANCANGNLIFSDSPSIEYAVAELSCDARNSTNPSSVVQEYWARTSFELSDFQVTVNKSGSHNIVNVVPADGVRIVAQGHDFVTFGPATVGWIPGVFKTRRLLGTITYNKNSLPPADDFDKDVGPRTTWCWTYTNISFSTESYLHDSSGATPFMYLAANRIGTRWDCSPTRPGTRLTGGGTPKTFSLSGNYPNPFNPQTLIAFEVPVAAPVKLDVIDLQGRRVATLVDGMMTVGRHEVVWYGQDQNGRPVASGTYFYRLQAEGFSQLNKMLLLK